MPPTASEGYSAEATSLICLCWAHPFPDVNPKKLLLSGIRRDLRADLSRTRISPKGVSLCPCVLPCCAGPILGAGVPCLGIKRKPLPLKAPS